MLPGSPQTESSRARERRGAAEPGQRPGGGTRTSVPAAGHDEQTVASTGHPHAPIAIRSPRETPGRTRQRASIIRRRRGTLRLCPVTRVPCRGFDWRREEDIDLGSSRGFLDRGQDSRRSELGRTSGQETGERSWGGGQGHGVRRRRPEQESRRREGGRGRDDGQSAAPLHLRRTPEPCCPGRESRARGSVPESSFDIGKSRRTREFAR